MDFNNDWRNRGQLEFLKNAKLKFVQYKDIRNPSEHYHCDFCFDKMSNSLDTLKEGFFTENNIYICSKCFNDLNDVFEWTLIDC